jgi:hypothetical protein
VSWVNRKELHYEYLVSCSLLLPYGCPKGTRRASAPTNLICRALWDANLGVLLKLALQDVKQEVELFGSYNDLTAAPACGIFGTLIRRPEELVKLLDQRKIAAKEAVEKAKGKIILSLCMSERKTECGFGFAPIAFEKSTGVVLKPSEAKQLEDYQTKELYQKMKAQSTYIELNCAAGIPQASNNNDVDPCPYRHPATIGSSDEQVETSRQDKRETALALALLLSPLFPSDA